MQAKLQTPCVLSLIIAMLAAVASAGGLFFPGLYRDNVLITCAWRGNDLITLAVAVPGLLVSMLFALRGSQKALLVWAGMLGYMVYNYIFYLYGAVFNVFFLLYVLLFTLSIYAIISVMIKLDVQAITNQFRARTPVKWIGGFMVFFAVLLGAMWIAMSLSFVFTGVVPQPILQTGHPTGVVFATDLSLLVSAMVIGGVLLWRRRSWGYSLAAIVLIKACTYGAAMITMSVFSYNELGTVDPFIQLWIFLSVGCIVSCGFLLGNMRLASSRKEK